MRLSLVSRLSMFTSGEVHLGAQAVTGAMDERVSVAGVRNDLSAGVIHLRTLHRTPVGQFAVHELECRVAGIPDRLEDGCHLRRHPCSAPGSPGYVGEAAVRPVDLFAPQIDQKNVASTNRRTCLLDRFKVGIGGVGVDGYDWCMVGVQALACEPLHNELLKFIFGQRPAVFNGPAASAKAASLVSRTIAAAARWLATWSGVSTAWNACTRSWLPFTLTCPTSRTN